MHHPPSGFLWVYMSRLCHAFLWVIVDTYDRKIGKVKGSSAIHSIRNRDSDNTPVRMSSNITIIHWSFSCGYVEGHVIHSCKCHLICMPSQMHLISSVLHSLSLSILFYFLLRGRFLFFSIEYVTLCISLLHIPSMISWTTCLYLTNYWYPHAGPEGCETGIINHSAIPSTS